MVYATMFPDYRQVLVEPTTRLFGANLKARRAAHDYSRPYRAMSMDNGEGWLGYVPPARTATKQLAEPEGS